MPATVAYTYLGLNTPVRADYEDPDVRWDLITGSGVNPYAGLDRFGRTIDCRWEKYSSTAADLARLKYDYNRASSRQWRDDAVGSGLDEFYTYDAVQRLIDMDRGTLTGSPPSGITSATLGQEWTLDPTGNWSGFEQTLADAVTQTRTSNMDNEITNITNSVGPVWRTPTYNDAGDMLSMPSAGTAVTPTRFATYDAWNRTTRIMGNVTGTGDYRYDGLNRRTTKVTLLPSETRHFYYSDQWQVLEERVGSSTDAERQHVWGLRYVDDLALRDRDTNGDGSLDERLYSMQDDNWNVVAVCNPSAVVQERYAYTPYGMIQFLNASFGAITASAFAWRYLYTGRERDVESSLQYNRNRYYHARLGCWTTRDPIGYDAGDLNLYRYAHNRVTRFADPIGLRAICPFEIVAQTFIPQARVSSPFGWFAGDNRRLDTSPGDQDNQYRTRLTFTYKQGDSFTTDAGVTFLYADGNPKSLPVRQAEATEGNGMKHRAYSWQKNEFERFIRIEVEAGNPLISEIGGVKQFASGFNPKINYTFTLIYDCRDNSIRINNGRHDGFPSYEVFARSPGGKWKNVYYHDASTHNPLELFGGGDHRLSEQGRIRLGQ